MKMTSAVLKAILDVIVAADGPFDPAAAYLGVFTAIDDKGQATALSDVTQATGDAATRVHVTPWSSSYKLSDGRWVADGPVCAFRIGDSTEHQVIIGWFLASAGTAGTLKAWGLLPQAVELVDEFTGLQVIPRVTVDPAGRWSAEVVYNG